MSSIKLPFSEKLFNLLSNVSLVPGNIGNSIQIYKLSQQKFFIAINLVDKQKNTTSFKWNSAIFLKYNHIWKN